MENPCKVALESSGIGLFVNYLTSTQQADFHNYEPPGHTIVHFCDKAGEVCGSYVMLRTLAETVRGAGALGYSWLMRREASQLAYEGVTAATATRPTLTTTTTGQVINEEIACCRTELLGTFESRIAQLDVQLDVNAFSRAGQVLDRKGLTKAGRALQKHGGRPGSAFSKPNGNLKELNLKGQFQLDDILTHPNGFSHPNRFGGLDYLRPDGSGARFYGNGQFRGFLEPNL